MQKYLLEFSLALTLITSTAHAGWFHNEEEQQRRIQVEQQLQQQQQKTGNWQLIAGGSVIFTFIAFTTGAILGARAIKNGKRKNVRK
jgi:hypothetical protein